VTRLLYLRRQRISSVHVARLVQTVRLTDNHLLCSRGQQRRNKQNGGCGARIATMSGGLEYVRRWLVVPRNDSRCEAGRGTTTQVSRALVNCSDVERVAGCEAKTICTSLNSSAGHWKFVYETTDLQAKTLDVMYHDGNDRLKTLSFAARYERTSGASRPLSGHGPNKGAAMPPMWPDLGEDSPSPRFQRCYGH